MWNVHFLLGVHNGVRLDHKFCNNLCDPKVEGETCYKFYFLFVSILSLLFHYQFPTIVTCGKEQM